MARARQIPVEPEAAAWWRRDEVSAGLIAVAVFLVYLPVWRAGFIWDDDGHVTKPALQSFAGLGRIWTEPGATQQYYPLLHSAFWVLHRIFGDQPAGYHLVTIALHAANAVLVGLVLRRLAVPGAWLAAALFALHPVMVESVAWVSELKNTLSGCLYLAAALAWLHYEDAPRPGRYAAAFGLFALALLSKTVTATLPAALLVVAWWRRGRIEWTRDVRPLLPFFAAGILMGLMTARVEQALIGAEGEAFGFTPIERGLIAGRAVWFYLGKLLWPTGLSFWYPRWDPSALWWGWLVGALLGLGGLLGLAWRERGPLAGALFFGGTLFPVLGFFNVYPFQFSFVADHFQYLASLGVIVPVVAGLARFAGKHPASRVATGLLLGGLACLTWRQASVYTSARTLYAQAATRSPESWIAQIHLGKELQAAGEAGSAVACYEEAIRLKPDQPVAHYNLGTVFVEQKRWDDAFQCFGRAVELKPTYAAARHNLGVMLAARGRLAEAVENLSVAVSVRPDFAEARRNLGQALLDLGRATEAVTQLSEAARLDPGNRQTQALLVEAEAKAAGR